MFYLFSKLFWIVFRPLNLAIFLIGAGIILGAFHRRRLAGTALAAAVAILAIGSWTNSGALLLKPLEQRFEQPDEPPTEIAGIIILGGAFDLAVSLQRNNTELVDASDRYVEGLALARHYADEPIVFTGGTGALGGIGEKEAFVAQRFFTRFGIERDRLVVEPESRTTHENALRTAELIDKSPGAPWILVTSAYHMPRSVGVFRQQGFDIVPWPVDYKVGGEGFEIGFEGPENNMRELSAALKEWIGLVAYNLTGRTDTLFPME